MEELGPIKQDAQLSRGRIKWGSLYYMYLLDSFWCPAMLNKVLVHLADDILVCMAVDVAILLSNTRQSPKAVSLAFMVIPKIKETIRNDPVNRRSNMMIPVSRTTSAETMYLNHHHLIF